MKLPKTLSSLFLMLGALLLTLALLIGSCSLNASPNILHTSEAAAETADAFMGAVCSGDFTAAEALLYGNPSLGLQQEPSDAVGAILWNAFLESTDYTLEGQLYATDSGMAQDVSFTSLDLFAAADALGQKAQELLPDHVERAASISQVYDEKNQYREDFILTVVEAAADVALKDDSLTVQQTITLNLIHRDGQWWISPDAALLSAISGGIAG